MNYNDDKILSIEEYEAMAKAYSDALKEKGFMFVKIDNRKNEELIDNIFSQLAKIKTNLFYMGGFLNTSQFYSLNERQIKKMRIIFDYDQPINTLAMNRDKTINFLNFISNEAILLKQLIKISSQSNFENEIINIVNDRLNLLGEIFK